MYTLFFAYDYPCLKPSRTEHNLDIIHYFELYLQEFLEYYMANKLGIFSAITVDPETAHHLNQWVAV